MSQGAEEGKACIQIGARVQELGGRILLKAVPQHAHKRSPHTHQHARSGSNVSLSNAKWTLLNSIFHGPKELPH